MRVVRGLLAVFVATLALSGCSEQERSSQAGQMPATHTIRRDDLDVLRSRAREAAEKAGDAHPQWARVVQTTEQAGNLAAFGAQVAGNRQVFLVEIHGEFEAKLASRQRGASAPRGNFMILMYERGSFDDVAFGLGGHEVDLSALGRVQPLDLG